MTPSLTDIEQRILDFMVFYLKENTYQPSIREIGERFGIKSTKTVSEHLQSLAEKGFLERDPSRSRGVRILNVDLAPDAVSVPCYRDLPDGRPETRITMDRRLAGTRGSFFMQVREEHLSVLSMLAVGVGDYLLVEPAGPADVEEGALALVQQGGAPFFARAGRNGRGVSLEPLSGEGAPVTVESPSDVPFLGQVVALYRRLDGRAAAVSLTAH